MADKNTPKTAKRRLRPATSTMREQAAEAAAKADRPQKPARIKRALKASGKPLRPVGRLGQKQPFKFIGKVLHVIGLIVWPRYFRRAFGELKYVTWPNFTQTRRLTFAVLAFALVFGAVIASVDYGLDKLFKAVFLK